MCTSKLKQDLDTITEYVNVQNLSNSFFEAMNANNNNNIVSSVMWEYAMRNIFNRLSFIFMKNTKKEYPNKYGYSLSKKNNFLKLTRILFRFNNGLDGKNVYLKLLNKNRIYQLIAEEDIANSAATVLNPNLYNIVYCISNFNTNIKTNNKEIQRLNKEIGSDVIGNIQKLKLEILKFSPKQKLYPLIDLKLELKSFTREKRKMFQKISYKFYSKLLEINSNNNSKIIYFNRMYRKIKELMAFILNVKIYFKNNEIDNNFLMIIYKEIFYICIKYMNRDNFTFYASEDYINNYNNNTKRFSFGILYLILFYLEFNLGLKIYIKEFLLDLYINRYYPHYCKYALTALNNNYRYDWIMSSYEIHHRLFYKNKIVIKIYFTDVYYEIYYIDEHTTVYDLYLDIYNNSEFFKNFKNKKLYWIYLVQNDPLRDELLPDDMKENYEQEINEINKLTQKLRINSNNSKMNIEGSEENNNSISINNNNSTFISNNINNNKINEKKKEKKIKLDEDYLQYLNDNKGFNKEIFCLDSELYKYKNNLDSIINDYDNNSNYYNNNIDKNEFKLNLNDTKKEKENESNSYGSSVSYSSSQNSNSNKDNDKSKSKSKTISMPADNKKESIKSNKIKEINNYQENKNNDSEKESVNKKSNYSLKRINIKSTDFVLEFLGNMENKLLFNFSENLKLNMKNGSSDEENISNNEENNINSDISSSCDESSENQKIKKIYELPGQILPDDAFKFDIIFNYFHFQICPRFFSPPFLNEKIIEHNDNNIEITEEEQDNIFELVSKCFTYDKRNEIVKYDLGKKLGILLIANMRLYNNEIIKSSKLLKYKKQKLYFYFFPKNILQHSAFKNVIDGIENLIKLRMNSTLNKSSLENEFIKICMNYKEFYSSIYENVYIKVINDDKAKIDGINENLDLINLKLVNICINYQGISFLEKDSYAKLFFFDFCDIVKIYLKDEYTIKINIFNENKKYPLELKIEIIFNYKEDVSKDSSINSNDKNSKKNINFNEYDSFFLYEDIISFIEYNLLSNTQTKLIKNMEDFDFIYMKKIQLQNFEKVKKLNEIDINRFKKLKKSGDIYPLYKEKEKEKIKEKQNIYENEDFNEIEEKEDEINEEEDEENKSFNNKDILSQIMKANPKMAYLKEIREKEKEKENEKMNIKSHFKMPNKSIFSSNSSITANNENEDDFFSDIKITNLNDNVEKEKRKKKQKKLEEFKKKKIDIEELLNEDIKTEDIMLEIEEEQKKWEQKINSSNSSFNVTSSLKNNNNNEYKINIFEFNNLDEKQKMHILREKKLENKIDKAQNILGIRDLVSFKRREELNEDRIKKESNNSSQTNENKSNSESSYLSFLSKNQRYPF